jgi:hypothetical protein
MSGEQLTCLGKHWGRERTPAALYGPLPRAPVGSAGRFGQARAARPDSRPTSQADKPAKHRLTLAGYARLRDVLGVGRAG